MKQLLALWRKQPILVITFVEAVMVLLVAFNVDITTKQMAAVLGLTIATGGLLGWSQVSPAEEGRWLAPKQ